jgi:hypothetical protein
MKILSYFFVTHLRIPIPFVNSCEQTIFTFVLHRFELLLEKMIAVTVKGLNRKHADASVVSQM